MIQGRGTVLTWIGVWVLDIDIDNDNDTDTDKNMGTEMGMELTSITLPPGAMNNSCVRPFPWTPIIIYIRQSATFAGTPRSQCRV